MALSVHGFFEGFALGVQHENLEIGYIFLAIFFHKWVEALTIVLNLFY
jgi:zinc transporter ZupT